MMDRSRQLLSLTVAGLMIGTAACGGASPPQNLTPENKFEWAVERYRMGEYGAATTALQEFLVQAPLHVRADSAQFLLGRAYFQDGKYLQAAEAFNRLARNRPTSELADDAVLGVCRSYWALSPELPRDQQYTRDALEACTRLLQLYPGTDLRQRAEELQRQARAKLAAKNYRVATWYIDNELYESANIYLQTILEQYSDTPIVPRAMLTLYRSYREVGFEAEAQELRERLLREYPDSEAAAELESGGGAGEARAADRTRRGAG